jgi:hypothetical protein
LAPSISTGIPTAEEGGNRCERTVLISVEEYQRLKRRDRQVLTVSDFTEADIAALEATRAPESSKAFDPELPQ